MKIPDIMNTPEKLVSVVTSIEKRAKLHQKQMVAASFVERILSMEISTLVRISE